MANPYGNPFQNQGDSKSPLSWMSAEGVNGYGTAGAFGGSAWAGAFGGQTPEYGTTANGFPTGPGAPTNLFTGGQRSFQTGGASPNPFGPQGALYEAGMSDINRSQAAADRQWNTRNNLNSQFGQAVNNNNTRLTQQLGTLNQEMTNAENNYSQSIKDYTDRTAQSASAMAAGISRNAKNAMKMAESPLNADGTQKTQQQIDADKAAIMQDVNGTIQQQLAPLYDSYNQNKAGMEQGFSAFKAQNQMQRNAALLNAVQYDLTGRNTHYQQVSENPETVVGKFDMMLALANMEDARNQRSAASMGGGWSGGGTNSGTTSGTGPVRMTWYGNPYDPNRNMANTGTPAAVSPFTNPQAPQPYQGNPRM